MRVLITGASRGLGACLSNSFKRSGYDIVGVARTPSKNGDDFIHYISADLSCVEGLKLLKSELIKMDPFDIIIHNLGVNIASLFVDARFEDLERMLFANTLVPMELTQFILQESLLVPRGKFVFINSMSHYLSYPGSAFYGASKDALHSFVRSLDITFANRFHFMQVYPGPMDTDQARDNSPRDSDSKRQSPDVVADLIFRSLSKNKRFLIPGIANKFFFLVSRFAPGSMEKLMKKVIIR